MQILFLCTGNSCRSQMAEGILRHLRPHFKVFSAGVKPEKQVSPIAVQVMAELGIDISKHKPKNTDTLTSISFDYVITVCDHAKETCPVFTAEVKHIKHIGFPDPFGAKGSEEEVLRVYRSVRDDIFQSLKTFLVEEKL